MLVEKADELIQLSQRKIKLQEYAKNLEAFQTRQEQINKMNSELQPIVDAVNTFREQQISNFTLDPTLQQKLDQLLNDIIQAEDNFNVNHIWIIDNENFNGKSLIRRIDFLKEQLEKQLKAAWKNYLTKNMPSTDEEMLNLLSKVPAFSYDIQTIRQLDKQIKQVNYPQDQSQFEFLVNKIEDLKKRWNNLSADNVPEKVVQLLRAAANPGGASLNMLTPEVLEWVNRHGIASSLRIRLISQ
ncbi:MAG: hypothetical protein RLZZ507_2011 [Cyanobacteriota bacterium]|jgi:hypothetical protein